MAAVVVTEAQLALSDGKAWAIKSGVGENNTLSMSSDDSYSRGFSSLTENLFGDAEDKVISGRVAQKGIQVAIALAYWIGNRVGYSAQQMNKPVRFGGLRW